MVSICSQCIDCIKMKVLIIKSILREIKSRYFLLKSCQLVYCSNPLIIYWYKCYLHLNIHSVCLGIKGSLKHLSLKNEYFLSRKCNVVVANVKMSKCCLTQALAISD